MNYTTREKNGAFWVIDTRTDEPVKTGPYANEASAKRRIRALKQRDAGKAVTEHTDQPSIELPTIKPIPMIVRGVYPAISKNEYRRRWN